MIKGKQNIKNIVFDGNGIIYKKTPDLKKVLKKGVKEILKKLDKEHNLFILTDGRTKIKIKKQFLKEKGVLQFFKDVLATHQINDSKKSGKSAFLKALKRWNIKKENTIFVGHSKIEIENAEKAELRTIMLNDLREIKLINN